MSLNELEIFSRGRKAKTKIERRERRREERRKGKGRRARIQEARAVSFVESRKVFEMVRNSFYGVR